MNKIKLQQFLRNYWKHLLVGTILIIVWLTGYSKYATTVAQCHATVERYINANFSEDYQTTCTETDAQTGKSRTYTCTETREWTERASPIFKVNTTDGELTYQSHQFPMHNQYQTFYPPYPEPDYRMESDYNFDYFSNVESNNLRVSTVDVVTKTRDHFNDSTSDTPSCLAHLNQVIIVKTWWGISYGSEW